MSSAKAANLRAARSPKLPEVTEEPQKQAFIGTSGWAYASWKPEFYPDALPQKRFLEYYATQLNSVEVNYTFRQLPSEKMLSDWMAASSAGFRFSFKAPQRITHTLRLKNCSEAMAALSQALAPVVAAGRMGVILFQLPPNFKADAARLNGFLEDAKTYGLRMALEFRNSSWFCDEVYAVLRDHGVALCIAESDEIETPDISTASFKYYRFRKGEYSSTQLSAIAKTLRQWSATAEAFAYFKHEEQPTGALRAVDIRRRLQRP